jgi:hypothetical protein
MGIQINGNTDTITAIDGGLTIQGADLPTASVTNLNVSGVTTTTTLRATSIVGVSTAGITTAYIGAVNDGPISGARNRIINGDMRIDQRNAGASVTPTDGQYTLDRWVYAGSQTSKVTIQRNAGAVAPPVGFSSYMGVTSSSAYSSVSSDYFLIQQNIEGLNISDLAWGTSSAKTVTLSFWVRSSLTGTFSGCLKNVNTRGYVFTYIINIANTWEFKTITISGDTTGTWADDNSSGIRLTFDLGSGSTYKVTAGSWQSGNIIGATGSVSLVGTNGATWYVTGVQLEAGTVATPFERRSYGQELALCQRYCYRFGGDGTGYTLYTRFPMGNWSGSTSIIIPFLHPPMRSTNRSVTGTGAIAVISSSGGTGSSTPTYVFNGDSATDVSTLVNINGLSGGTDGNFAAIRINGNANAYVLITSEL